MIFPVKMIYIIRKIQIQHMRNVANFILFFLSVLLLFMMDRNGIAEDKIPIGVVEEVIILPWGVRMPARIDTGAATSSLDARGLIIKGNIAEFKLPDKYGGLQLKLPIVNWKVVRSAQAKNRRPVVEIELCLGPKRLLTKVNLIDRSGVKYPMIIGRNVLRENFVVDCMKSSCAPPACQEAPQ